MERGRCSQRTLIQVAPFSYFDARAPVDWMLSKHMILLIDNSVSREVCTNTWYFSDITSTPNKSCISTSISKHNITQRKNKVTYHQQAHNDTEEGVCRASLISHSI
jgi:hypothetical protein